MDPLFDVKEWILALGLTASFYGTIWSLQKGIQALAASKPKKELWLWASLTALFTLFSCIVFPPDNPWAHFVVNLVTSLLTLKALDLLVMRGKAPKMMRNDKKGHVDPSEMENVDLYTSRLMWELRYESFDICTVTKAAMGPPDKIISLAVAVFFFTLFSLTYIPEFLVLFVGQSLQLLFEAIHKIACLNSTDTAPLFHGNLILIENLSRAWTVNWHQLLTSPFMSIAYWPLARFGKAASVMGVFTLSGVWHTLFTIPILGFVGASYFIWFMMAMGLGCIIDSSIISPLEQTTRLTFLRRTFAWVWLLSNAHWMFYGMQEGMKHKIGITMGV